MKGGVIAALHALAALRTRRARAEVVLQAVASEEDGGLGAFAALERDAAFDACLIPEPTGFEVVCAQAGALTFRATVRGRAAHAAIRLEGRSALDRYIASTSRSQAHERAINRDVEHPAMRTLALPYPVSVGRIEGGDWSSSVPDRVTVEGRLGVPLGHRPRGRPRGLRGRARRRRGAARRDRVDRRAVRARRDPTRRTRGSRAVAAAVRAERGAPPRLAGVPYGADMRLFCARGIPTVMVGTPGLELRRPFRRDCMRRFGIVAFIRCSATKTLLRSQTGPQSSFRACPRVFFRDKGARTCTSWPTAAARTRRCQ